MSELEAQVKSPLRTWRYMVRVDHEWHVVVIESNGIFMSYGTFGTFGHFWSHPGEPIRAFIADLGERASGGDADYVLSKLSKQTYDGHATHKAIVRAVCEMRRSLSLTKKRARNILDDLEEYDVESFSESFSLWLESPGASKLDDAWELRCESYPGDAVAFATRILPELAKKLRAELVADEAQRAPKDDV